LSDPSPQYFYGQRTSSETVPIEDGQLTSTIQIHFLPTTEVSSSPSSNHNVQNRYLRGRVTVQSCTVIGGKPIAVGEYLPIKESATKLRDFELRFSTASRKRAEEVERRKEQEAQRLANESSWMEYHERQTPEYRKMEDAELLERLERKKKENEARKEARTKYSYVPPTLTPNILLLPPLCSHLVFPSYQPSSPLLIYSLFFLSSSLSLLSPLLLFTLVSSSRFFLLNLFLSS